MIGEINKNGGALAGLAGQLEAAAVNLHDLPADREPEAEAALRVAAILRRKVWRKDAVQVVRRDALALVDDADALPVALRLDLLQRGQFHANLLAAGGCVDGIAEHVHERALDE